MLITMAPFQTSFTFLKFMKLSVSQFQILTVEAMKFLHVLMLKESTYMSTPLPLIKGMPLNPTQAKQNNY